MEKFKTSRSEKANPAKSTKTSPARTQRRPSMEQFVALLEHEHLLGDRIFACGAAIAAKLAKLTAGKAPPLDKGKWISPPKIDMLNDHQDLRRAMAFYVHLIDHFAGQMHLQAEGPRCSVTGAR